MQRKYFPAVIMLTAGAVTCIISIVNSMDILSSLIILLGVLIVFYLIGLLGNWIITKVMESGTISAESEEETEEDSEGENPEEENPEGEQLKDSEGNEENTNGG